MMVRVSVKLGDTLIPLEIESVTDNTTLDTEIRMLSINFRGNIRDSVIETFKNAGDRTLTILNPETEEELHHCENWTLLRVVTTFSSNGRIKTSAQLKI